MRILVAGFPHSGTSILRKLIGNHPDIHDHYESETDFYQKDERLLRRIFPRRYHGKRNIVFKWPFHEVEDSTNADRIIYIVRNPFDVFGSLKMRFGTSLPEDHSLAAWQRYARFFLAKPVSGRDYKIRYEDMFSDDFRELRSMTGWLGLDWHDDITNTSERYAPIRYSGAPPQAEPPRSDHAAFRAWQTAQQFTDRTGQSRRHLDSVMESQLTAMPECRRLGYGARA